MTALRARTRSSSRHAVSVAIEVDGQDVAVVEARPARRVLPRTVLEARPREDAPHADPDAWSPAAADRAASARWSDPHPAIRTVTALTMDRSGGLDPAAVLEAVGAHLEGEGIRRLDVRVSATDPLVSALTGPRWVRGSVGGDVVASLSVSYPWATEIRISNRLQELLAPLPQGAQRTVRRLASVHPRQLPEMIRTATTEVAATMRRRSGAGRPRSMPGAGAPAGAHPFAASRYRTVRSALAHVPDTLRSAPLIDIGCGDGRVLVEALAGGFSHVYGREFDAVLAARARDAVGGGGTVALGDALAEPLPDDVGVIFLNNPFDRSVLLRFAPMVAASLERRPRPLLVLYLNPRPIEPLLQAGLVLVEVNPLFSVLASRAAA